MNNLVRCAGRFSIANPIQLGEYSTGDVLEGVARRIATRMATRTSGTCTGMTIVGTGTTTGSTTTLTPGTRVRFLPVVYSAPSVSLGAFDFVKLPYQPPSIFPISSSFSEMRI